jgi:hypothetical protein
MREWYAWATNWNGFERKDLSVFETVLLTKTITYLQCEAYFLQNINYSTTNFRNPSELWSSVLWEKYSTDIIERVGSTGNVFDVTVSSLGQGTDYPDWFFVGFLAHPPPPRQSSL